MKERLNFVAWMPLESKLSRIGSYEKRSITGPLSFGLPKPEKLSRACPCILHLAWTPRLRKTVCRATTRTLFRHRTSIPCGSFFYGTLADPVIISRILGLAEVDFPTLRPSAITGGSVLYWGGKYKALVDGSTTA